MNELLDAILKILLAIGGIVGSVYGALKLWQEVVKLRQSFKQEDWSESLKTLRETVTRLEGQLDKGKTEREAQAEKLDKAEHDISDYRLTVQRLEGDRKDEIEKRQDAERKADNQGTQIQSLTDRLFKQEERIALMRDAYEQANDKHGEEIGAANLARENAEKETLVLQGELKQRDLQIALLNQRIENSDKLHTSEIGRMEAQYRELKADIALQIERATTPFREELAALRVLVKQQDPTKETEQLGDKAA